MSFYGKSQTRKRTKRKMKETSRTMRVTTMRKMAEAIRCAWTVRVSAEG
jgi:hypothetical protein